MKFFTGTHLPHWLEFSEFPLFVSVRTLRRHRCFRDSVCSWALDSGGFSELSMYGKWETSVKRYCREYDKFSQFGGLEWAAIQDWMCEEIILKKTGLSVLEHQTRTVNNYADLLNARPNARWCPVLQGYTLDEYKHCLDLYQQRFNLFALPIVGLGTMCRRQGTKEAEAIVKYFTGIGLKIHAFGFKTKGLATTNALLTSSDSLAWSFSARKNPALPGHSHKNCANCYQFAQRWRSQLLNKLGEVRID